MEIGDRVRVNKDKMKGSDIRVGMEGTIVGEGTIFDHLVSFNKAEANVYDEDELELITPNETTAGFVWIEADGIDVPSNIFTTEEALQKDIEGLFRKQGRERIVCKLVPLYKLKGEVQIKKEIL